jgi:YVTN family beta-propeller protein
MNLVIRTARLALGLSCGLWAAWAQATTWVYATNNLGNGTVTVINHATQTEVARTLVGSNPTRIIASPDGTRVYVSNLNSDTVSVMDTSSHTVIATIPVGDKPETMAITADGTKLYVINYDGQTVSVVDTLLNAELVQVPIGEKAKGIEISPDGHWVYVANRGSGTVTVIDTFSDTVQTTIAGVGGGNRVLFNLDGSKAYVATGTGVSVLDVATHLLIKKLTAGDKPIDMVLVHSASRLFVGNVSTSDVTVVDTITDEVLATVTGTGLGPWRLAVSPDSSTVYAACSRSDTLSIIDVATMTVRQNLLVGDGAFYVAVSSDGTKVYTSNPPASTVSSVQIDLSADPPATSVVNLPTRKNPWALITVDSP